MKRKKVIRMVVEVSCPAWLSAADARREVRTLINDQTFYGTREAGTFNEIDDYNFRARSVRAVAK